MKEIGIYLKNLRVEQGRTIEDVARKTKIHPQKLTAIEEGDEKLLPAKVFYIGLVKSYGRELKANPNHLDELCIEAFKDPTFLIETQPPLPTQPEITTESQNVGRFQVPKSIIILISLCFAIGLIVMIGMTIDKMNSYSQEELVPDDIMGSAPSEIDSADGENQKKDDSDNDKKDDLPKAEEKTSDQSLESAQENLKLKPSNEDLKSQPKTDNPSSIDTATDFPSSVKKEVVKKEKQKAQTNEEEQQQQSPPLDDVEKSYFLSKNKIDQTVAESPSSSHKLTVIALEPIQVEVIWSDGYVQKMLLKTRESKTLVFSTAIKIKINNGGAVQLSYDSEEAKIPGVLNKAIELSYP